MKTRYKHIHFVKGGGRDYNCLNNKTDSWLGDVEFYPRWKKYVFAPDGEAVFDTSCLADVIDFMKQLS